MPWWLYAYLGGYGAFTFFWVRDEIRDRGSKGFLAAELLSDSCMVLVALGYWLLPVRAFLGKTASIVFVAGLAWLLVAGTRDIRETWPSKDGVLVQAGTALFVVGLYGLFCGPLLYWGFSYAVLGNTGGT
ncbi:hypothetical protein J2X06_001276 [Lysobacter niastensis]|uniref:Uncharacterized protein n=1 Tax=Lysobacter niastensis TaxID=380629 RepID=A0ABU1W9F2_9GAMM|nr:hypothetical protein [Lysobacter niastensis]MDR7134092.1 hypothetical protein [Lysobacter niastensis]